MRKNIVVRWASIVGRSWPLFALQIPRYVRDDSVAVHVRRTALRGARQACTVTVAVCSMHSARCPLPMLASVEVALPVRQPQARATSMQCRIKFFEVSVMCLSMVVTHVQLLCLQGIGRGVF